MKVFRVTKVLLLMFLIANIVLLYFAWNTLLWRRLKKAFVTVSSSSGANESHRQSTVEGSPPSKFSSKDKVHNANKHIRKSITIVFYGHYNFEHDLKASIDVILEVIPNMPILVLQGREYAYPPIIYERNLTNGEEQTVRFMNMAFDIKKTNEQLNPLNLIHTKYVLFMPDSVRLNSKNILQKILREMNTIAASSSDGKIQKSQHISISLDGTIKRLIIVPFAGNLKSFCSCAKLNLDLPNWTLEIIATANNTSQCELYLQKHAILLDIALLKTMPEPFSLPFPEMLYIQAKMANVTATVYPQPFQEGRRLFTSFHNKQRRMELRRRQFREMYKKLQIKRVIRRIHKISTHDINNSIVLDSQFSSSNFSLPKVTEIDLIGCERSTKSCIGTVYNNRPFYYYMGRNSPPCCLDKLKTTFNHVLEEFENVGIRYWLDNYALKSAVETNQLSLDAYDIDISFNVQDLERSNAMKMSQTKPHVDHEGFYWIKATDGHYFRVQFSKINQVGVNLLPYEINGNYVRASDFFGWKANTFSADYLHPMSTVLFLGNNVMCPNNVLEYLESKNIKVKSEDFAPDEE